MAQKSKNKITIFTIIVAIVLAIGITCFVLAYGLSQGWAAVGAWFGSKWAILLYIALGCYALFVIWVLVMDKIRKTW